MLNFSKPSTFLKVFFGVLILIILLLFVVYDGSGIGTYGVNKTIGWGWEFTQTVPLLAAVSSVLSIVLYLILSLLKLKINKYVAVLHLLSILILSGYSILLAYGVGYYTALLLFVVSIVLLIINTAIAIMGYKKNNLHS